LERVWRFDDDDDDDEKWEMNYGKRSGGFKV